MRSRIDSVLNMNQFGEQIVGACFSDFDVQSDVQEPVRAVEAPRIAFNRLADRGLHSQSRLNGSNRLLQKSEAVAEIGSYVDVGGCHSGLSDNRLERFLDFHFFETFNDVAFADIVVALDVKAAIVARNDFFDVVFEAFERSELAGIAYDAFADKTHFI